MYKHLFAVCLIVVLLVQSIIPSNKVAAEDDLSIDATVNGAKSLEIGENGSVTTTVNFDLIPGGKATAKERKPMDVVIVFDKSGSMDEQRVEADDLT
jgi:Mg-chelatase subunit ChlD